MEQKKKKVVLAFSGGLDTSFCVKYLSEDLGYEVHTAIANTGGFSEEELKEIERRAVLLGAASHAALDVTKEYYINDYGNQVKILIDSVFERYLEALGIKEFEPKDGESKAYCFM